MSWWEAPSVADAIIGDEPIDVLRQALQAVIEAYTEDLGRPPSPTEICYTIDVVLNEPKVPWRFGMGDRERFMVMIGATAKAAPPFAHGSDQGRKSSGSPKPGAFFRIPRGQELPAYGQILAVGEGCYLVRSLHTVTAEPSSKELQAAGDLIPPEVVKATPFEQNRWMLLGLSSTVDIDRYAGIISGRKPLPAIRYELKIARRRTEIGMGPHPDA